MESKKKKKKKHANLGKKKSLKSQILADLPSTMELHVVTNVIHLGVETLSLLESHSEGLTDRTKCNNKHFLLISCLVLSAILKTERS